MRTMYGGTSVSPSRENTRQPYTVDGYTVTSPSDISARARVVPPGLDNLRRGCGSRTDPRRQPSRGGLAGAPREVRAAHPSGELHTPRPVSATPGRVRRTPAPIGGFPSQPT